MKSQFNFGAIVFVTLVAALFGCNQIKSKEESKNAKPNIILIVADDLGYSDIGPFGGDIHTPALDKLAKEGMLFSNFHVLPTCSPTRSVLLTGYDNHIAGLGVMGEASYPALKGLPGYSGHLSDQVVTFLKYYRKMVIIPIWQVNGIWEKKKDKSLPTEDLKNHLLCCREEEVIMLTKSHYLLLR